MSKKETQGFDISRFSAVVTGCGGLGCNVAVHLAGSGIGRLYLCDFDTVSESNLNRQFLYCADDIGAPKAQRAAQRLKSYAPDTEIIPVDGKITSPYDLAFACGCDMIFIAADNNALRRTVTDFCFEQGIPFVNGGINGFYGTVYLCVPGLDPCPECAGLLSVQEKNILSVSSTAGIIGALEAETGIRHLINPNGDSSGVLHIYDNGEISGLKISSRTRCGRCSKMKGE